MQTIFACATAPIKSGVAIIRVSGSNSPHILKSLTGQGIIPARTALLRKIKNPVTYEIIDEAVILYFPTPNSFTGEDVVEFHIHGSRAVISEMLEILSTFDDTRLACPGEFSKRAFDNGKMDLTEAEGLADLIDAETKAQARQAMRQKQGILGSLYDGWRSELISILANIEAYIDFPDEPIPDDTVAKVVEQVRRLKSSIAKHLNDNRRGEKLRSGINAVIAGAPNTGKSSLINYLSKRDVAIVSEIAGTTRDSIEVHLDLGGYPLTIIDTAGLRKNADTIEAQGIKIALQKAQDADINILLFDANQLPDIDKNTLSLVNENSIIVINKIDLKDNITIPDILEKHSPILISTKEQIGLDKLLLRLEEKTKDQLDISSDPVITRQRHRSLLIETNISLDNFSLDDELEIASENLRQAAVSLGKITGHINIEEILDSIFSNFCIGK
ncbi:MAG: tRNA uridine-5-carboxymethylaminomethyl(34) synthesis GTPase MnmE [Alphaproteobacteria bacterium CG11_big_fil_rev_8_21_14_0_20_39_49]|nr:MAG: tRNA uridine-5-carboxymethylaminomethyl(34) synthesis GTPase MnmE [Alphaproteobacteria bacterium CG11_big_fil_rev_8_21_14_0_20_39_49]